MMFFVRYKFQKMGKFKERPFKYRSEVLKFIKTLQDRNCYDYKLEEKEIELF